MIHGNSRGTHFKNSGLHSAVFFSWSFYYTVVHKVVLQRGINVDVGTGVKRCYRNLVLFCCAPK